MMDPKALQFCIYVREQLKANPEWQGMVISAAVSGVADAMQVLRSDRNEWEGIAMNAVEARLFTRNKPSIADRIEALEPRACFRWAHVIEAMRK